MRRLSGEFQAPNGLSLPRVRSEEELNALLEASGGLHPNEIAMIPNATKEKISRCMALLEVLPEEFVASLVKPIIQGCLKITDFQRYLLMLCQGGFVTRSPSGVGRTMTYVKTEAGRLSGPELARAIHEANDRMVGYENRSTEYLSREKLLELLKSKESTLASKDDEIATLAEEVHRLAHEKSEIEKELEQAQKALAESTGLTGEFLELAQKFEKTRELFPGMTLEMYLEVWLKARKGSGGT